MVIFTLALSFSAALAKKQSRLTKRGLPPDYYGGSGGGYDYDGGYDYYGGYGGGYEEGTNIAGFVT